MVIYDTPASCSRDPVKEGACRPKPEQLGKRKEEGTHENKNRENLRRKDRGKAQSSRRREENLY